MTKSPCFLHFIQMPWWIPLLFFLTSCHQTAKNTQKDPAYYFNSALKHKENKNFKRALEDLGNLNKNFFYSSYNQKALLLKADIYFADDKFSLAASDYEKHLQLYPQEKRDYVLYQTGLSYKNQLPGKSDNDLSLAEPALQAFQQLSHLKSPYKQKALKEKQDILNKKAEKEFKTASFFKKQNKGKAAFKRLQYIIQAYPNSPLMPQVFLLSFQLARQLNKNPEKFKNELIKNYPNSKETKSLSKGAKKSNLEKLKKKIL